MASRCSGRRTTRKAGGVTTAAEWMAFLNARLREDEAVAREAAGLTEHWIAEEPAAGVVLVDGEPLIEGHITGLTAHIALHDPARELREVAAKRDTLNAYLAAAEAAKTDDTRWRAGELFALRAMVERYAEIWSGHPDYPRD
jgi:hypothetical protein